MSEQTPEAPVNDEPQDGAVEQQAPQEQAPQQFDEAYVRQLRAESAKYRTEAKAAQRELERARQAQMSEAERAVAEAEARGRSAAAAEFGKELARTRFDALAGRRNPDVKTDDVLEFVDLSRFLSDDGRPDEKALQAAVERLVPTPQAGPPSFDGGVRTTSSKSPGMDELIRRSVANRSAR